ncbi:MAG: oligoendopeptidase F, partial [Alphaproteobacteria bacterium]|nr:oligoendopeptidase F [Alphaproteobacteria bacterium]
AARAADGAPAEAAVWDLTDLYPDLLAWEAERKRLEGEIERLTELQGTLGTSAQALAAGFGRMSQTERALVRLYIYATLAADADTLVAEAQAREQAASLLFTAYGEATSWVAPELLAADEAKIRTFLLEAPLANHRFAIAEILRSRPHVLGEEAEKVLAAASVATGAPQAIYNLMANADMPWKTITLSTGETVKIDQAAYSRLRQSPVRADRKAVFDAFWSTWAAFSNTVGMTMNGHVQGAVFAARARHFDTVLEAELDADNLPKAVYDTLIAETRAGLPALHRYFRLRGRMLGVEEMRYYDIYPPLVSLDKTYTLADTKTLFRQSAIPLGEDYLARLDAALAEDWMHVYPQEGKRSGAYMNGGAYDVHPYVLLNHKDDYDSLSTFAHEWGHVMHSVLTNESQPYELSDYSTFIAEIASITNEMLLHHHLQENAASKEEKIFYLGQELEQLRGTFFRQAMFSEFEQAIHAVAEGGDALTGERLNGIYGDLLKAYHGHDKGVVTIDDLYANEWAFVPHFYNGFYVFQYATSIAGAAYFAEHILEGDPAAREGFLDVLRAGGSDHPYEILRRAGLDMASPEPYRALVTRMNVVMDEIEALLAE